MELFRYLSKPYSEYNVFEKYNLRDGIINLVLFLSFIFLILLIKKIIFIKKIDKKISTENNKSLKKHYKKIMMKIKCSQLIPIETKKNYKRYITTNLNYSMSRNFNNDPDKVLDDFSYNKYIKLLKNHMRYKRFYLKGVLLWMTSSFWLLGIIITIKGFPNTWTDWYEPLLNILAGASYSLYLTKGLIVPISFAIAVYIYPILLKKFLFHNKWIPYSENILNKLGYQNHEKQNALSVLAGSFLGRFIK